MAQSMNLVQWLLDVLKPLQGGDESQKTIILEMAPQKNAKQYRLCTHDSDQLERHFRPRASADFL
jgi:hypothetical protein